MEPEKIDLRKIQKYVENPLVAVGEIRGKQKTVRVLGTGEMMDTSTGRVLAGTAVVVRKTVDDEHFVKVFAEGVKASFDLSPSGFKVFQLVLKSAQNGAFGADSIYLYFMDAVEDPDLPISQQTFHRGLKELLTKRFIAASNRPNIYWINPHLFFKGDRVAFVTEYVKRSSETKVPDMRARDAMEASGQMRLKE
jgi:Firmicute plasmid replication protein (RepL)